ncbi:MAG TPA: transglutaminase family protein, partial [Planctomycetaceae bacterium]|nr:transglutaminase family protein [Planctomycetaceae bacterium]
MPIRVALHHETSYQYDRAITLGPQTVRLRPAPHSRTPIRSYSLKVFPEDHFLNWQQDPHGNFQARLVFPKTTRECRVEVDLIAEMTVINPFDFFIEDYAEEFPFEYEPELKKDLKPFLDCTATGPEFLKYAGTVDVEPQRPVSFLVKLNSQLQADIDYLIRMEPGVQTPEETLAKASGSCRDSAWLLVQLLRHFGLAARFVSGYLIQLVADQKPLEGPEGTTVDFTDLHAWTEVFLPGAGWVGLDPTSGLFASEGHIPLAATPSPSSAAPISGGVEKCETEFSFKMSVTRVHEDPRVTKPYSTEQWERIDRVGTQVDERLARKNIRLTMGGEPTFVSIDDMESPEWNTAAVGEMKQQKSVELIHRLRNRFAPGALLHFGQGKWYPGESLPRWAYTCLWRRDGEPIWSHPELLTDVSQKGKVTHEDAAEFMIEFAERIGVEKRWIRPAYEDVWHTIENEQRLPVDVDPRKFDLDSSEDRRRLARTLEMGVSTPVGYVLPLQRAWWQAKAGWKSGPWPFRTERLFLIPGDSPIGLRLPLESMPSGVSKVLYQVDPFDGRPPLPAYLELRRAAQARISSPESRIIEQSRSLGEQPPECDTTNDRNEPPTWTSATLINTAMCIEPRNGQLHVFMPPAGCLEDYLELVALVEETAVNLNMPVVMEGYLPPHDPRLELLKVTPDPGVIEVNVPPAHNWEQLKEITTGVYDEARQTRLGTEKFELDGKHTGTGGGNHVVLGGATPEQSPFLNRPDLLKSLLGYWNNHPALSYVFSGQFIGPTSQAPRVDEGRRDAIYELEIAFAEVPDHSSGQPIPAWLVDRIFRHLLVDLTGNTHRAEFCIDKLYSPDSPTGRLGLVEFRAFEMPPHAQMSLAQQLLVRSLLAMFADQPYNGKLIHWGTAIHDRFMLPHWLKSDLWEIVDDLNAAGIAFEKEWFEPHLEFRCPYIGEIDCGEIHLEIRQAIEPWYVLGEEPAGGGTARYVDSSLERIQVKAQGLSDRYTVTCNGHALPLTHTGQNGEFVAGVRYRAWQPPSCLHPTIPTDTPLTFDVVDRWNRRSLGGCQYHIEHPGGLNTQVYPVNSLEAESRRASRFFEFGHT